MSVHRSVYTHGPCFDGMAVGFGLTPGAPFPGHPCFAIASDQLVLINGRLRHGVYPGPWLFLAISVHCLPRLVARLRSGEAFFAVPWVCLREFLDPGKASGQTLRHRGQRTETDADRPGGARGWFVVCTKPLWSWPPRIQRFRGYMGPARGERAERKTVTPA
jgi:hypothetical protein